MLFLTSIRRVNFQILHQVSVKNSEAVVDPKNDKLYKCCCPTDNPPVASVRRIIVAFKGLFFRELRLVFAYRAIPRVPWHILFVMLRVRRVAVWSGGVGSVLLRGAALNIQVEKRLSQVSIDEYRLHIKRDHIHQNRHLPLWWRNVTCAERGWGG